jgi:hypothetical protein
MELFSACLCGLAQGNAYWRRAGELLREMKERGEREKRGG